MKHHFLFLTLMFGVISAQAEDRKTIVFIGDSITAGYGLDNPSAQAYPALIQEKIDAIRLDYRAVNAGLSGDTTAGGMRRINWLLRQKIDILVLALGGNDGLRGVAPNTTKENLLGIIERTRATYPQVQILVAGMQMPANMGDDYATAFRNLFPAVASQTQSELIPFLLEGVGGDPEFNQIDLIHPTAEGQRLIAETVWLSLKPLLLDS